MLCLCVFPFFPLTEGPAFNNQLPGGDSRKGFSQLPPVWAALAIPRATGSSSECHSGTWLLEMLYKHLSITVDAQDPRRFS